MNLLKMLDPRAPGAVARLERDHAAAVLVLGQADAALDSAAQAYAGALGEGRDAAFAARRVQSDAEVDRDVAQHAVKRLAERLQAARDAAASAEVERLTTEARTRQGEFVAAVKRELKSMAASARLLARLRAEADLARNAALQAGADAADLPEVEEFRNVPARPMEDLETKRVSRWVHPWSHQPLNDEQTKRVSVQGAEAVLYDRGGGGRDTKLTRQAEYDRVVYREYQHRVTATSLLEALSVPGLMADDVAGWSRPPSEMPDAVLAHIAALEGAPTPDRSDRRESKIEYRPVS